MLRNFLIRISFNVFFLQSYFMKISSSANVESKTDSLVQMRVVKETANYGYFGNSLIEGESTKLETSVPPSNFSGPQLLHRLVGKCFNLTLDKYRYSFCPFENFTQYEVSTRWNAYQGILGVWSHWYIKNNTFAAMVYKHGDHCGDINRSVKVYLECGSTDTLVNVTEPERCQYSAIFTTRYLCHPDAALVYPRLTPSLQSKWNNLHTEFHYGDITKKGYELGLQKIFQEAGIAEVPTTLPPVTTQVTPPLKEIFSDLATCNQEYTSLQSIISKLNMEVATLKMLASMAGRTSKPNS